MCALVINKLSHTQRNCIYYILIMFSFPSLLDLFSFNRIGTTKATRCDIAQRKLIWQSSFKTQMKTTLLELYPLNYALTSN